MLSMSSFRSIPQCIWYCIYFSFESFSSKMDKFENFDFMVRRSSMEPLWSFTKTLVRYTLVQWSTSDKIDNQSISEKIYFFEFQNAIDVSKISNINIWTTVGDRHFYSNAYKYLSHWVKIQIMRCSSVISSGYQAFWLVLLDFSLSEVTYVYLRRLLDTFCIS